MRPSIQSAAALALLLASNASLCASALKLPFKRSVTRRGSSVTVSKSSSTIAQTKVLAASSSSDNSSLSLSDVQDLIYIANVTIGGTDFPVQLDTGSSDLWVMGDTHPLPNSTPSDQTYNISYGIGWGNGTVSYAAVEFAGISVSKQAFLDVSTADNPALSYGASGILGLGFTGLSSIDALINKTGSSDGRALLYNLFQDNPSEPNFIAISLHRDTGTETVEGTFSIGQYDDDYKDVENSPALATFPVINPDRWTVLLDALLLGTDTISVTTTVDGAPSDKAVALLDSGTSYTYAPTDVCNSIYGNIEGASYSSTLGQWIVPCDAEIDIAFQFNGSIYPMHPLDVAPQSLTDSTTCVGSFIPQSVSVGAGQFDWLIGDNFLRSVYTVYDFGDFDSSGAMGDPYIKLLSVIDPNQASADFHSVRGGTANDNVTYNAATGNGGTTTVTLSSEVANTLNKVGAYFPAMLGVMALNALVLILLLVGAIVFFWKRRGSSTARTRRTRRGLSPMPMNRTSTASFVSNAGQQDPGHSYEPVSMALSEDTVFVPPAAAFRKYEGDTLRSGDTRPKSMLSQMSGPHGQSGGGHAPGPSMSRPSLIISEDGRSIHDAERSSPGVTTPPATATSPPDLSPPVPRRSPQRPTPSAPGGQGTPQSSPDRTLTLGSQPSTPDRFANLSPQPRSSLGGGSRPMSTMMPQARPMSSLVQQPRPLSTMQADGEGPHPSAFAPQRAQPSPSNNNPGPIVIPQQQQQFPARQPSRGELTPPNAPFNAQLGPPMAPFRNYEGPPGQRPFSAVYPPSPAMMGGQGQSQAQGQGSPPNFSSPTRRSPAPRQPSQMSPQQGRSPEDMLFAPSNTQFGDRPHSMAM